MKRRNIFLIFAVGAVLGVIAVLILRGPRTEPTPATSREVEAVVQEAPPLAAHQPSAAEPAETTEAPAAPPIPDVPKTPKRERRSTPDRVTGVKSWLAELEAEHTFDAERLEAQPCFSSGDVDWIEGRWEDFDEDRRDLLAQVDEGEAPEAEQEWAEMVETLREEIGETGYNGILYGTNQPNGILVSNLGRGTRGQEAGLKTGDRVIHYNGVRVHKPEILAALVQEESFDYHIEIEVRRFDGTLATLLIEPGPIGGVLGRVEMTPCPGDPDADDGKKGRGRRRGPRRGAEAAAEAEFGAEVEFEVEAEAEAEAEVEGEFEADEYE